MSFIKHKKRLADLLKGMSIVEITAAIGIIGIISIMVVSIYFAHFRLFSNQSKTIDIANENRISLDAITNQIRESSGVASSCCSGSYTTSSTVLVLQLWPLDASGNPIDPGASNYDYIIVQRDILENTKLVRITIPSATSSRQAKTDILSTDVSNLQFAYLDSNEQPVADQTLASEVKVTLTNTSVQFGKTYAQTQETKAVIRNK